VDCTTFWQNREWRRPDNAHDLFQRSASYVDRILKGAKPTDLPVQAPTRYELALNLKTAKAIWLDAGAAPSPAPTR
jgi:putative ABC transport system substrate-binding protein